jgi:hypothetical protein
VDWETRGVKFVEATPSELVAEVLARVATLVE